MRMYFLRTFHMGQFFEAGTYTKNELMWLSKQKKEFALKHHPDRGWSQWCFVAMMKEYETIKEAIKNLWQYEQVLPAKNGNWRSRFYSGTKTIEEEIRAQKEYLKEKRQRERAERYSAKRLISYILDILSGSKVQTMLLVASFPFIFRWGLPYGIEGILVLFSIHLIVACVLGKNLLAFLSIVIFSLIAKSYEPIIPFEVWNTVWNTVNFLIFTLIISTIARVKPREEPMDWDDLWNRAKQFV